MRAVLMVALLGLLPACGGPKTPSGPERETFRFDSGGAYHIEGFGAWRLGVTRDGRLDVEHQVRDETRRWDPGVLDPAEAEALWVAIDGARLREIALPDRPGVPDEVRYVFTLERPPEAPVRVEVWQNDLMAHPRLPPLLDRLRRVVEARTAERPVF